MDKLISLTSTSDDSDELLIMSSTDVAKEKKMSPQMHFNATNVLDMMELKNEKEKDKKEQKPVMFFNKVPDVGLQRKSEKVCKKTIEREQSVPVAEASKAVRGRAAKPMRGKVTDLKPSAFSVTYKTSPESFLYKVQPSCCGKDPEAAKVCIGVKKLEPEEKPRRAELKFWSSNTPSELPRSKRLEKLRQGLAIPGNEPPKAFSWDPWDDISLIDHEPRRMAVHTCKSTSEGRRPLDKLVKKENSVTVSDSELLAPDHAKQLVRNCDRKSRGDNIRRDMTAGSARRQVQWNKDVDVIYFSSHMNSHHGVAGGEVVERVVEPLREEWQQQRTGLYAKGIVPSQLQDHWVSLLNI